MDAWIISAWRLLLSSFPPESIVDLNEVVLRRWKLRVFGCSLIALLDAAAAMEAPHVNALSSLMALFMVTGPRLCPSIPCAWRLQWWFALNSLTGGFAKLIRSFIEDVPLAGRIPPILTMMWGLLIVAHWAHTRYQQVSPIAPEYRSFQLWLCEWGLTSICIGAGSLLNSDTMIH